jgi:hypothetical protein
MNTADSLPESSGSLGSSETRVTRSLVTASKAQVVGTFISAAAVIVATFVAHRGQVVLRNSGHANARETEGSTADSLPESSGSGDSSETRVTRSLVRAARAQVVGTFIAAVAVIVAIYVASQGQQALRDNALQTQNGQLATALTALGSGDVTLQTTGLLLLGENTFDSVVYQYETGEAPDDVVNNFINVLQTLSIYLRSHSTGRTTSSFGPGYGIPLHNSSDVTVTYAADQIALLLGPPVEQGIIVTLNGRTPTIDLAGDELSGQEWAGVNFSWVLAYLAGIDLRGADMYGSQWSMKDDLAHSYLQCANLEGADFQGADLAYADLRGADVQGADFRGANLEGARLTQLYGTANWSAGQHHATALAVSNWSQAACLQNSKLWDNQPSSSLSSSTTSAHSPKMTTRPSSPISSASS